MSLTYPQIEGLLAQGLSFHVKEKESVTRADPMTDNVVINEMTALNRMMIPLEVVVDRARANGSGSDLADVAALKRLLAELSA